jgi:hypothetical protein
LPSASVEASTPTQGFPAEDAPVDNAAEIDMMNVDQELQAEVDRFVDEWDIEAELARIMAEI